jgi:prevent-host-death family protein
MARVPEIIPITDLRQGAAEVLRKVKDSRDPLVITQRGRAAAVMLSMDAYEQAEHERSLLLLLARGDKEMAAGAGIELDDVLAEADRLLDEGSA